MDIIRAGSTPTRRAPAEWFAGVVWIDAVVSAPAPARVSANRVTFTPGARTHWHTHPLGQTLHVLSGVGRVQKAGEPVREIRPGDTVWIPPGVKHWHGSGPTTAMTHLAIQESVDGSAATWLEPVSDADFGSKPE